MSTAPTAERRRQERETFEQLRAQSARWFSLRLSMCYTIVGTLVVFAAVAIWMVLNPERYSATAVALAATALFTDTLGLIITIFRLVLRPGSTSPLKPVTRQVYLYGRGRPTGGLSLSL